jgi:hypothetical protein
LTPKIKVSGYKIKFGKGVFVLLILDTCVILILVFLTGRKILPPFNYSGIGLVKKSIHGGSQ